MKNKLVALLALFLFFVSCAGKATPVAQNQSASVPELISLNSKEGMKLFQNAEYKIDFFPLANNFQSQSNGAFCGVATATIILNTLNVNTLRSDELKIKKDKSSVDPALVSKEYDPFLNRYTQNNIFDASYVSETANRNIKPREQVLGKEVEGKRDGGIQLRQLDALFDAHGLHSDLHIVTNDADSEIIKEDFVKNLANVGDYVVVNYKRSELGQKGGGHISPLGAYHKKSNSVLVMDVNPSKADWVWVKMSDLIAAMRTMDTVENRGYLLISK